MIGVTLVDHIKSAKLTKFLKSFSKCCLISYLVLFLVKIILYFDVHSAIKDVDDKHEDKGLGSFMAEYVDDTTGSVVLTSILLFFFLVFYLSNFYIIRLMNKMLDLINS